MPVRPLAIVTLALAAALPIAAHAQRATRPGQPVASADPRYSQTEKPPLHGKHWLAITGKPLSATAGAMAFQKGGNAVDAAVAMLAAGCTMWDTLSCGGETQALIYDPHTKKVIGIDALGVAPTGATAAYYKSKGYSVPAGVRSARGRHARNRRWTADDARRVWQAYRSRTRSRRRSRWPTAIRWKRSSRVRSRRTRAGSRNGSTRRPSCSRTPGAPREAPEPGEIFVQKDLAATWRKLVAAEQQALRGGATRKQAIYAAYDRFYKGDIAREIVRGVQEDGGLFTMPDLANWKVRIEEPLHTSYRGIEVYKLPIWQQGPAMLQALNILENADVKAMGYNSPRYIHAVYQTMSLAFADRDFYYGDPYFPPEEPVKGLLSKEYAKSRFASIDWTHNDSTIKPGDPYPFQGGTNPFASLLAAWKNSDFAPPDTAHRSGTQDVRTSSRLPHRRCTPTIGRASRGADGRMSTNRSTRERLRSSRPTKRDGSCR